MRDQLFIRSTTLPDGRVYRVIGTNEYEVRDQAWYVEKWLRRTNDQERKPTKE